MSEHCFFCGGRLHGDSDVCVYCGAVHAPAAEKRIGALCPRCHDVRLVQFALGPVGLQACGRCQGAFLPASEWDNLLEAFADGPLPPAFVVPEPAAHIAEATGPSPYRQSAFDPVVRTHAETNLNEPVGCPTCTEEMDRFEFGNTSNVFVDVCRVHGIWLDAGEIDPVVARARKTLSIVELAPDLLPREPSLTSLLAKRLVRAVHGVRRSVTTGK